MTWDKISNGIIDYSRKIQKAKKGRLFARAEREAKGSLLCIRSWGLGLGYLDPRNPRNPRNSEGSQLLAMGAVNCTTGGNRDVCT